MTPARHRIFSTYENADISKISIGFGVAIGSVFAFASVVTSSILKYTYRQDDK